MSGDVSKLPKWAQNKIQKLQWDIESLEEKLKQARGNQKTNVYLHDYVSGDYSYLPENRAIKFKIGKGDMDVIEVMLDLDNWTGMKCVEVRAVQGALIAIPSSSNVMKMGVAERE